MPVAREVKSTNNVWLALKSTPKKILILLLIIILTGPAVGNWAWVGVGVGVGVEIETCGGTGEISQLGRGGLTE
jgi:hypothetical protein